MRTLPAFTLPILLLTLGSANAQPAKPAPAVPLIPNVVLTGDAAAMVLKQGSRDAPTHVSGYWTPTQRDIQSLEAVAPYFLRHETGAPRSDWNHYARQYAGFVQGGHKMIYVNCAFRRALAHDIQAALKSGGKTVDWRHKAFNICDGGENYFGMEYDVASHQFHHLSFNGPG